MQLAVVYCTKLPLQLSVFIARDAADEEFHFSKKGKNFIYSLCCFQMSE